MHAAVKSSASKHFIDAVICFLHNATDCELEVLASRLQPYRIDFPSSNSSAGATIHPILVLDNIEFLDPMLSTILCDTERESHSVPDIVPGCMGGYNHVPPRRGVRTEVHHSVWDRPGERLDPVQDVMSSVQVSDIGVSNGMSVPAGDHNMPFPTSRGRYPTINSESPRFQQNDLWSTESPNARSSLSNSSYEDLGFRDSLSFQSTISPLNSCSPTASMTSADAVFTNPDFEPFFHTNETPLTQTPFDNLSRRTPIPNTRNPTNEASFSATDICPGSLPSSVRSIVLSAVRDCARPDFRQYMVEQLPRWVKKGLWHQERRLVPVYSTTSYDRLIRLYHYVCQLDQQMADDDICKRASLVLLHHQYEALSSNEPSKKDIGGHPGLTGPGRGQASLAVEKLLSNIHPEWSTCHTKHKAVLRTNFHNRKRYGKRWSILVDCLGPGILFICSSRLVGIVTNTRITMQTLRAIADAVRSIRSDIQNALHVINPISRDLVFDGAVDCHAAEDIIRDLLSLEDRSDKAGQEMINN